MNAKAISRPPRGRPAKVTKPSSAPRRASRHSSVAAEHLEQLAQDAEAEHNDHDDAIAAQHNQQGQFDLSAAANILANGPGGSGGDPGIHPDLQALVPQQAHYVMEAPMDPGALDRSAEELAKESGYIELLIDSALAKRLAGNSGQRIAVQRRQDQTLNLKRRSNVEALLAHTSGQEAASPCKSCHKGYGPWNGCVVVAGQMCGSCANCWFNASGSRCSFHETNNPQHIPAIIPPSSGNAALAGLPPLSAGFLPPPPGGFAAAGLSIDQLVKGIYDQAMSEARSDDPNVRYQFRIGIAARQLALATVEYGDYLSSRQEHEHDDVQHEGRGPAPEATMDEGDDGP